MQNNVGRLDEKTYTYEENGVPVFYNKVTYEYTSSNVQIDTMTVVRGTSATNAGDPIEYRFEYDDNGNITAIYDVNDDTYPLYLYEYDALGQLVYEEGEMGFFTYTYDAAGNMTANHHGTFEYTGDQMTLYVDSNEAAVYNRLGNLISYGDYYYNEYVWQGRELVGSYDIDYHDYFFGDGEIVISNEATYTYNADGIRTSKTVNGITHKYILDGAQIVAEKWVENNVEHMMVFLYDDVGSPIGFLYRTSEYAKNAYDAYFYEKNFFGDVTAIYNESGSCVARYAYNAWGEHTVSYNSNGIAEMNPIRYRGYYYDTHTGLYYLQSRYYNPAWGRFISPDCYVSTGTGFLGYNMYIYCNNNPVMYVDPEGRSLKSFLIQIPRVEPVRPIEYDVLMPFVDDLLSDILAFDPNNTDELKVYEANYFSCYNGRLVILHSSDFLTSGAFFGTIFLNRNNKQYGDEYAIEVLRHEYGHSLQEQEMGTLRYFFKVGIPSIVYNLMSRNNQTLHDNYESMPWEYDADRRVGIQRDYAQWAPSVADWYFN